MTTRRSRPSGRLRSGSSPPARCAGSDGPSVALHGQKLERQRLALAFVRRYLAEHGRPPTVREVGEGIGVRSTSLVNTYLDGLERLGCIERSKDRSSRSIRVIKEGPS